MCQHCPQRVSDVMTPYGNWCIECYTALKELGKLPEELQDGA